MVLMMVQTGPVYNNTALCPQNNKVREFIALFQLGIQLQFDDAELESRALLFYRYIAYNQQSIYLCGLYTCVLQYRLPDATEADLQRSSVNVVVEFASVRPAARVSHPHIVFIIRRSFCSTSHISCHAVFNLYQFHLSTAYKRPYTECTSCKVYQEISSFLQDDTTDACVSMAVCLALETTRVSKKLCIFVSVRTSSNFDQL